MIRAMLQQPWDARTASRYRYARDGSRRSKHVEGSDNTRQAVNMHPRARRMMLAWPSARAWLCSAKGAESCRPRRFNCMRVAAVRATSEPFNAPDGIELASA